MRRVALALIHHPVLDRQGAVVTTAVTNLDVHDISRSSHTFGLSDLFIVHPILAQRELVHRIRAHWVEGTGARRIPDRKPAMELVRIVESLDDAIRTLGTPELWATSAAEGGTLGFAEGRQRIRSEGAPVLLCFGTGWGLSKEVIARTSERL